MSTSICSPGQPHTSSKLIRRSHAGHNQTDSSGRFSRRTVWKLLIPIGALLAPFLHHQSAEPAVWGYSRDYLAFLGAVFGGGVALAAFFGVCVRRVPLHRQFGVGCILLALLAGLVAGGELLFRARQRHANTAITMWGQIPFPFTMHENAADYQWESVGASYSTGSDTLRTHVASRGPRDEEFLIVAIGGSCTFGYGLNDDETWPHLLEQRLREKLGDRVTVLNAGDNGQNTLQQFIRLGHRVLPERPDMVIHYGAINDVEPAAVLSRHTRPKITSTRFGGGSSTWRLETNGFYFEHSQLISRALDLAHSGYRSMTRTKEKEEPTSLSFDELQFAINWYVRNMESMRALCEAHGVAFIPTTYIAEFGKLPAPFRAATEPITRNYRRFCAEHGQRIVDLFPAFATVDHAERLFFEDQYHPSREGARFIASVIAEAIEPDVARRLALPTHDDLPELTKPAHNIDTGESNETKRRITSP